MNAPQQAHDGTAGPQQQPAQPQPPTGAAGPPQHAVQQQQVAVPHQQPGTPTGVTVVSSGVGPQCVQVPTSSIQMQQQVQKLLQSISVVCLCTRFCLTNFLDSARSVAYL